ncbi:hypothetical protein ACFFF7_07800 [Novosphingobium aquiterrae]|uniref:Uncharacterized protein n=1 Tax=Novosphingobium aquiterrae TaxID=624388 RepID=A0ABV6PJR6_9SPHN
MLVPAAIGAALGLAVFAFARWQRYDRDASFYPTVLIVIASYYVLFAVMAGDRAALVPQLGVALVFATLAVIAGRHAPRLVGIGIALHGLYDLAFHLLGGGGGVPEWWPPFCGAIDIVLGLAVLGAVAWSGRGERAA